MRLWITVVVYPRKNRRLLSWVDAVLHYPQTNWRESARRVIVLHALPGHTVDEVMAGVASITEPIVTEWDHNPFEPIDQAPLRRQIRQLVRDHVRETTGDELPIRIAD